MSAPSRPTPRPEEVRGRGAGPRRYSGPDHFHEPPDLRRGRKITNSLGDYPEAVRRVAQEEHVALIDLNAMSKPFYEALGPVEAHKAFAGKDTTHHSDYGSYELAKCIVEGIRQNRLPLEKFLVPGLPAFDPPTPTPSPPSMFRPSLWPTPKSPMETSLLALLALAASLPTIFIAGDSTANNTNHRGWGDPVAKYFDLTRINVQTAPGPAVAPVPFSTKACGTS